MHDHLEPIARVIDILPDAVLVVDTSGRIVLANAAVADVLGFDAAALRGQDLSCLIPVDSRAHHAVLVAAYVASGHQRSMKSRPVLQALHRSGVLVPVSISLNCLDIDRTRYSVAVIRDARRIRDQLDAAIAQAETDPLTGIGNRLRLSRDVAHRILQRRPFALLYFDLTGFKPFNDLYGHAIGDEVLRLVARRSVAMVREQDLAARIGGDEFVMLLDGISSPELLLARAESVVHGLSRPFRVEDVKGAIGLSAGGALYPLDAQDEGSLLAIADANMYRAKKAGRPVVACAARLTPSALCG